MGRTQIHLTEEQAHALREVASRRGLSLAELIRQAVERLLEEDERKRRWQRALSVIGRYSSGHSDISEEHDRFLAEDYL